MTGKQGEKAYGLHAMVDHLDLWADYNNNAS